MRLEVHNQFLTSIFNLFSLTYFFPFIFNLTKNQRSTQNLIYSSQVREDLEFVKNDRE